jgi:hypothetical protein
LNGNGTRQVTTKALSLVLYVDMSPSCTKQHPPLMLYRRRHYPQDGPYMAEGCRLKLKSEDSVLVRGQ